MPGPLRSMAEVFRFNNDMLNMTVDGFSPEDWAYRPVEGISNAHWILGHLTYERRRLMQGLGIETTEEPWEKMFHRRTRPEDVTDPPTPASLIDDFCRAGEILFERLNSMTKEETEAEWADFPQGSSSKSAGIHFLFLHECYHVGQLSMIRRLRGKKGIA